MPDPKTSHGPALGVSPFVTLVATVTLLSVMVFGIVESPENADKIIDRVGLVLAILVLALRQDYNAYRLAQQTAAAAADAKELVKKEALAVRQTTAAVNAVRDDKLESMATDIRETAHQTNSMKDDLIKAVKEVAFAAGAKSETDKQVEAAAVQ